jgi:hypothetical protein
MPNMIIPAQNVHIGQIVAWCMPLSHYKLAE